MKKTIRFGIFETNSSSTHSLVMLSPGDLEEWKKGTKLLDFWNGGFITSAEAEALIAEGEETGEFEPDALVSYDQFVDAEGWCEGFYTSIELFTTPGGEDVYIASYYGWA